MGANPLQAVTNLYSRPLDLPSWVDPTILRYILIVHPTNSPLNPDECNALYNAIKKQYNLHVHLLHLSLLPAPKPIPIIPLPPQLPPSQTSHGNAHPNSSHSNAASISGTRVPDTSELLMTESDAQSTGKFVREFLTQSLVPWMEKCVIEWNEAVNFTLFSYGIQGPDNSPSIRTINASQPGCFLQLVAYSAHPPRQQHL